jgi:hypothetical protein
MRIFVLGDSFADNLFAHAYRNINRVSPRTLNDNSYYFSQIQRYLISMENENIDKAKWWTDWLEEWGYEIVNLGKGGCSNYNIIYQFAKIDKEFKQGDRIILHWTDHSRFDWIVNESGENISHIPQMDRYDEPLKTILNKHSVCVDESFKRKHGYLHNHLIPFMDWIVEKHSEYNPIIWSVFKKTINYLNKSRYINHLHDIPYSMGSNSNRSNLPHVIPSKNKFTIVEETNGFNEDLHYGRRGNYYMAVLFDEILKSEITINFDDVINKEYITDKVVDRIKKENLIFKNPSNWPEYIEP